MSSTNDLDKPNLPDVSSTKDLETSRSSSTGGMAAAEAMHDDATKEEFAAGNDKASSSDVAGVLRPGYVLLSLACAVLEACAVIAGAEHLGLVSPPDEGTDEDSSSNGVDVGVGQGEGGFKRRKLAGPIGYNGAGPRNRSSGRDHERVLAGSTTGHHGRTRGRGRARARNWGR